MNQSGYKWYTKEEVAEWPEGHKKCRGCDRLLPLSAFHTQKQTLLGVNNYCKECRKPKSTEAYSKKTWEEKLWERAKSRAAKKGIPFTITVQDVLIPEKCPVLNVPITLVARSTYAPSLDQKEPGRGYTPDNIIVMSYRANTLKNNASKEEVKLLHEWMQDNCQSWTHIHA